MTNTEESPKSPWDKDFWFNLGCEGVSILCAVLTVIAAQGGAEKGTLYLSSGLSIVPALLGIGNYVRHLPSKGVRLI
jgi:hypothetical protein